MKNLTYTENITDAYADTIIKGLNIKNLAYSILGLFLSAAMLTLPSLTEKLPPSLNVSLFTLGIAGSVCSLAAAFLSNRRYAFKPTGSPLQTETKYIDSKTAAQLAALLERAAGTVFPDAVLAASNARVNIWRSEDEKFAAAQLALYRPHEFYPVTPIVRVSWQELKPLADKTGEKP